MRNLAQLKVCFLAGTLGQGGAERQLFHILCALVQNGCVPRVLYLRQNEFWESRIQALGLSVTRVGRFKSKLGRLLKILVELRKDPPLIFQSQHFYMNAYAGAAARMLGLVSIGALRSNGVMEMQDCGRAGGWLNLHLPHLMAANSWAAIRHAASRSVSPSRLFLLSNVVDTAGFRSGAFRPGGPLRLLAIGRLIESKRFDRFVGLIAQLRSRLKCEVKGILAGDGPLKESLRAQAASLGLPASALDLRGDLADLAAVYREADVFVMTSEYEGTPNVLLEAMASGLPVVATNVGGVPDVVHDGQNGLLVEAGDDEGLCAALERLVCAPELRSSLGQRAQVYVQANHSLDRLPSMLSALYERALGGLEIPGTTPTVESHAA